MESDSSFYNRADALLASRFRSEKTELEKVIAGTRSCLKASRQAGKTGSPIFDPVGMNARIKEALDGMGWATDAGIPAGYAPFGLHVDGAKNGVIVEAQFSNYPFLLNTGNMQVAL